jgi:hypothetical protein
VHNTWGRQSAIWTEIEPSFLSVLQVGLMHVTFVVFMKKLTRLKMIMPYKVLDHLEFRGQSYQWQYVQMSCMYMYLLYYYCVIDIEIKKLTVVFRLYKF